MSKVSIAELASAVSTKHAISQEAAEAFVAEFFSTIDSGLHAEKMVKVRGFGTFKVIDVRERESIDVNTGERVTIEGHGKVNFTPDPIMRDLVNKPFAKFDTVVLNDGVDVDELNSIGDGEPNEEADEEPEAEEETTTEPTEEMPSAEATPQEEEAEPTTVEPIKSILNMEKVAEDEPVTEIIGSEKAAEEESGTEIIDREEEANEDAETPATDGDNVTAQTEKPIQDEETEDEIDDEEPSFMRRHLTSACVIGALVIAAIAFAGGYLLGQQQVSQPVVKVVKVSDTKKHNNVADTTVMAGSTKSGTKRSQKCHYEAAKVALTEDNNATTATEKPTTQLKEQPETHSATLDLAQRQVKTGAYTITGTAQTVTVRKGQTLKSISKSHLGDGMECYIQVHNGVSDVSEGMKLKIPQLKLKRR